MHLYFIFLCVYLALFHLIINSRKHSANYNVSYTIVCLSYAGLIWLQRFFTQSTQFSPFLLNIMVPLASGLLGLSLVGMARTLFDLSRFRRVLNIFTGAIILMWTVMIPLYILTQNLLFLQLYYGILISAAFTATALLYIEVIRLRQFHPFQRLIFILGYSLMVAHGLTSIILARLAYALPPEYSALPGVLIIAILTVYTITDLVQPKKEE